MATMRNEGQLQTEQPSCTSYDHRSYIPPKIFQFWDQAIPPDEISTAMSSWTMFCDGYKYEAFDNERARAYLKQNFDNQTLRAFDHSKSAASKSDLLRFALLYNEGGVYADADDLCLSDISSWLAGDTAFVAAQEGSGALMTAFLAARPQHPFIAYTLEKILTNMLINPQYNIWYNSGPGMLTLAFCYYYREELSRGFIPNCIKIIDNYEIGQRISISAVKNYKKTKLHWLHKDNV
jgi:mannosyltransferase OCH1-like enzyme